MKKLILIVLLLSNVLLIAQVPNDIKDTHEKLSDFYSNNGSSLPDCELKASTEKMKKYYEKATDYYRYYGTKKKIIKGVQLYTDNDLFDLVNNKDHEYTGGFRIELITDHFGLKMLSWRRDHKYLSYQSLLFGFELYTPEGLNVFDVNDLNKDDRPFASFQYFGHSRNIISYDGKHRVSSVLKIGLMGGDVSRKFQFVIHRDITDSENNNGWDYQIANGGRLAIQYEAHYEWQRKLSNRLYFNYGMEGKIGFEKFSFTPTFALTTKSFFEKNPHNAINSSNPYFGAQSWCQQFCQSWFLELKVEPEVVAYNSMLQGYWTDNEEFVSNSTTNTDEEIPLQSGIYALVVRSSLGFGFRNYNTTILLEYYLQSPEYDYSWKTGFFHGYGRVSFTMNI